MTATPTSLMSDVAPLFDKMGVSPASCDLCRTVILCIFLIWEFVIAHMITAGGYSEQQLSVSLKRKHFMLLGNMQQLMSQTLNEHGNTVLHCNKLIT